jgi:hypothetical protein
MKPRYFKYRCIQMLSCDGMFWIRINGKGFKITDTTKHRVLFDGGRYYGKWHICKLEKE